VVPNFDYLLAVLDVKSLRENLRRYRDTVQLLLSTVRILDSVELDYQNFWHLLDEVQFVQLNFWLVRCVLIVVDVIGVLLVPSFHQVALVH
jgi:hypothetical protein